MGASKNFITPVSPKDIPTYYEKVLRPVCLMDIGNRLLTAARADEPDEVFAVTTMVDDIQLLVNNTYCFNVVGSVTLNNMDKVANTFERLLFDWLLAPNLPALEELNDEICYSQGKDDSDDTDVRSREERSDELEMRQLRSQSVRTGSFRLNAQDSFYVTQF